MTGKKTFEPEPIEQSSDGKAVLGYIISKDQLEAFQKEITKVLKGEPFGIATKTEGDKVKVKIFGISLSKSKELDKQIQDAVSVAFYAESSIDPTFDLFDEE